MLEWVGSSRRLEIWTWKKISELLPRAHVAGPSESGEGFRPTEESTTTLELELGQYKSVVGIEQRDKWHRADCQA